MSLDSTTWLLFSLLTTGRNLEPDGSEVRMMEGFTRSLPSSPLLHLRLAKRAGNRCLSFRLALPCQSNRLSHGHGSLLVAKHRKTGFRTIPTRDSGGTSCRRGSQMAEGSVAKRLQNKHWRRGATPTFVSCTLISASPTDSRGSSLNLSPAWNAWALGAAAGSSELAASCPLFIELFGESCVIGADGSQTQICFCELHKLWVSNMQCSFRGSISNQH